MERGKEGSPMYLQSMAVNKKIITPIRKSAHKAGGGEKVWGMSGPVCFDNVQYYEAVSVNGH